MTQRLGGGQAQQAPLTFDDLIPARQAQREPLRFDDLIPQRGRSGAGNVYDQFDAPAPPRGNVFDQFDAPAQQQAAPHDKVGTVTGLVRSAAEGVPLVGALANPLDAATDAASSYLTGSRHGSFGERYAAARAEQEAMSRGFEAEHPIASTAAGLAGVWERAGHCLRPHPQSAPVCLA
jgi:hypothetical protein